MKQLTVMALAVMVPAAYAQPVEKATEVAAIHADYEAAMRFAPSRMQKLVGSTTVWPSWLKHSDRFWYQYYGDRGKLYYLVDPARGAKSLLFDNDALASQLALTMRDAFDARNLPLQNLEFVDQDRAVRFEVKASQVDEAAKTQAEARAKAQSAVKEGGGKSRRQEPRGSARKDFKQVYVFEYVLATGRLRHLADVKPWHPDPGWANFSPDQQRIVYGKGHDLYWMDRKNFDQAKEDEDDASVVEHRLTEDGEAFYDYFGNALSGRQKSDEDERERAKIRVPVIGAWSQDSKKFALIRRDRRQVERLWVIDSLAKPRPRLDTYAYAMPGEENVDQSELWVFEVATGRKARVEVPAFKDQDLQMVTAPVAKKNRGDRRRPAQWLSASPEKLHVYRISRDVKRLDLLEVDVSKPAVRVLVEERFNTPNDFTTPWLVAGGKEFLFWSERDGWGHYYLYDETGRVKNPVTRGAFHAAEIEGMDEKARVLYFSAFGRESGENPYYKHLYRVNFDGSGLRLLNAGDFDHSADVCDSTRYFVDNYSRVDTVPKSSVRDSAGKVLLELETADLSRLTAAGYRFPEVFKVKADDGITDLYGVMYKPFRFDPMKKYPVILSVYPGPQTEMVDSSFGINMNARWHFPAMHLPTLAQFGYIVITVGNRGGNSNRSRVYQDFSYGGNFRDYGLADKKTAIEQLAASHDFIDAGRVGIFGHSGGGFMSSAALLVYPDFFKVAVSSAGNHENSLYNRWWGERYNGVQEVTDEGGSVTFKHSVTENAGLARNLKGHLLLVIGALDSNVHPAQTYRVAEALIQAGKRFDMLVVPSGSHGYPGRAGDYFFWTLAGYFNRHLLGWTPAGVDMAEMMGDYPTGNEP